MLTPDHSLFFPTYVHSAGFYLPNSKNVFEAALPTGAVNTDADLTWELCDLGQDTRELSVRTSIGRDRRRAQNSCPLPPTSKACIPLRV